MCGTNFHNGGAYNRTVGLGSHFLCLLRGGDAEADAAGQVCVFAAPRRSDRISQLTGRTLYSPVAAICFTSSRLGKIFMASEPPWVLPLCPGCVYWMANKKRP